MKLHGMSVYTVADPPEKLSTFALPSPEIFFNKFHFTDSNYYVKVKAKLKLSLCFN